MSGGGPDLPPPGSSAAWLARSVRDAEVAGSNPAFPTDGRRTEKVLVKAALPDALAVSIITIGELRAGVLAAGVLATAAAKARPAAR